MSKLRLLSIIFISVAFIAWIPLTIEVFGDINPDVIIISASIFGVGIIGACTCSIIRAIRELKKKSAAS